MSTSSIWAPIGEQGPPGPPGPQGPEGPEGPQGGPGPDVATFLQFVDDLKNQTNPIKGISFVGASIRVVATIAEMQALVDPSYFTAVMVTDQNRGGIFVVDKTDAVTPPNFGTIFVGTNGWRYRRLFVGAYNLKWFGAVGDNGVDDQLAIERFIFTWIQDRRDGYIPAGTYRMTGRFLVDLKFSPGKICPRLYGDGPYSSTIRTEYAGGSPAIHFYKSADISNPDPSAFQGNLDRFGFTGNTPATLAAFGLDDFSDNLGNFQWNQMFFGNANTTQGPSAVSCKLNYVFDSAMYNTVCVGNVMYGTALWIAKAHFCTFYGGSYSNADNGVYAVGGGSHTCTFISPDFENVRIPIYVDDPSADCLKFINGYYDVWNPVAIPPAYPVGGFAFYVGQAQIGGVEIDGARFARNQTFLYPYTSGGDTFGNPGAISTSTNYANLIVRGKFPGQALSQPAMPASDAAFVNKTGQTQRVRIGPSTAVFINSIEFPNTAGGTYVLNPGEVIAVRYSGGTPIWNWTAIW